MEKFSVYDFRGDIQRGWHGEHRIEKMSLKKCLDKVFSSPYSQLNMKQFWECHFYYDITKLSLEDIRDLVGKGYVFIPFSSNVDRDDVLAYINAGLKPLFMRAKEYITMKKEYEKIA